MALTKLTLFLFFMVAVTLFSSALTRKANQEKLKVLVLYESLCPDSVRFMQRQLGPNYNDLKDYIDISLVPFGKSYSENNGAQFYCQHGPKECLGNRQQSCILQQTNDQEQQVEFAVCQMTISNKSRGIDDCARSSGLSNDIDTCMTSELGTLLQLEAEQITHSYAPTFVPTIVYDGVFDQQLQDNSLRNFRGTVCYLLQKRGDISLHSDVCQ
ncbi:GILT-like protein 1 [Stomoxys calcitrans]|uniref:GILT-like protein 1 n=1 Tax=Stomoxys calcitrans TaxID=35570 RepID=UPI0027E29954|nr:GILT-like protein 1 [Stomoxys calcitrans]